jgi:tRNA dimethylallyltransferase
MTSSFKNNLEDEMPVLIAGPTASGKSKLALSIANKSGGVIINADSMQVYDCWQLLSARPSEDDLRTSTHELYGHVNFQSKYSTGHWLRDIKKILTKRQRPIIVGGTGLYFSALLNGLSEIPMISELTRTQANSLPIDSLFKELDDETKSKLDPKNKPRIQRAWEVLKETGIPLIEWQSNTPPPLLNLNEVNTILMHVDKNVLEANITSRFDKMLKNGVLEEVTAMKNGWDVNKTYTKVIGGSQMISYLNGTTSLEEAREKTIIASRQYAKRQRTWFRSNMSNWKPFLA